MSPEHKHVFDELKAKQLKKGVSVTYSVEYWPHPGSGAEQQTHTILLAVGYGYRTHFVSDHFAGALRQFDHWSRGIPV